MALPTKTLGPFTFKIDRPKGFVKKWPNKTFTYPCAYGFWPRLKGQDGEGLDAFVGDDPAGHLESFLKLKPDDHGKLVPDETKFLIGVNDRERSIIYRLYGNEVSERKTYSDFDEVRDALERFKPKRRKTASVAFSYGMKLALEQPLLNSPRFQRPAEEIGIQQKEQDVWNNFDGKTNPVGDTGSESAVGSLPSGGVVA